MANGFLQNLTERAVIAASGTKAFRDLTDTALNARTSGRWGKMQEALADAEISLTMDDAGWSGMIPGAGGAFSNDLAPFERGILVKRARRYYTRDALCARAIGTFTSYCIGRGLSIKAQQTKEMDDAGLVAIQQLADDFWEHPDNQTTFSTIGQHKSANRLNIDGEIFFMLHRGEDVTRVRPIMDCLEIVEVIANPEDSSEPWYYLRRWVDVTGATHTVLYPDISLQDKELPQLPEAVLRAYGIHIEPEAAEGVFILHVAVNTIGIRGNSLLTPGLDWAKVLREFLEDRATLSRAQARIAWIRKVKGNAAAVGSLSNSTATQNLSTRLPAPIAAGSTLTVNQGVEWESMNAQGGAHNAYIEMRSFKLQFCAAVGLPEHYFADGSNGTRATSKSMEKPVELLLTDYQTIWKQVYQRIFAFEMFERNADFDLHAVRVDAPKIMEDDTNAVVASIVELVGVLPEFNVDEVILIVLNALAVDDPQDVLAKVREMQAINYAEEARANDLAAGYDPNEEIDPEDPQALTKFQRLTKAQAAHIGALQGQRKTSMLGRMSPAARKKAALTNPNDPTVLPGPQAKPQFGVTQPGARLGIRKVEPPKTRPTVAA